MAARRQGDRQRDASGALPAWHAASPAQVLEQLDARAEGLTGAEAARRLARVGPNRLPERRGPGALRRLLRQFANVLIYLLLAAGFATAALGHWVDASVILGVAVINALIGFVQEGKAEEALAAIRSMLSPTALVLRDGSRRSIPAEELVPGDVVCLSSGDRVPADLRLLEAKNLRIDESALTGESVPIEKAVPAVAERVQPGERRSMAFSGTLVTFGVGTGVVVATAERTELGRISALLSDVEPLSTPLLRQMAQFGRWLSVFIVALAGVTFLIGHFLRDQPPVQLFLAAVSLAVAAIPEGMPAIMTITLAIGVQRMARRNAIVRRLPAVETLGSVGVICTDKTGTLTRNEMTVREVRTAQRLYDVTGAGYSPEGTFSSEGREIDPERDMTPSRSSRRTPHAVLREALLGGLLCNDASPRQEDDRWSPNGDPTEAALVTAARKAGLDPQRESQRLPRTDVVPFESEHRFMATLHHDEAGEGRVYLKGAPERVLDMCAQERTSEGDRPIDRPHWKAVLDDLARRGRRLLVVATRPADRSTTTLRVEDVQSGFTLLGAFGIMDPPRAEAAESVARCRTAGIRVKMITGDHALTAAAIGHELGIGDGTRVLTGRELDALDDDALAAAADEVDVFARTSPEHKLRLVRALQSRGHVVAMTGDGVNDAPALKRSDVGIAMGMKGTEAAKEAAELVLADDDFSTIAHAVEEGRTVYDNLRKAILFLLPTNGGQALVILTAIALGLTLPLTPVQVLWVNMVCAITLALALAFEPGEPGAMKRSPRRPGTPLLTGFLVWRVVFVCLLLVAGTFGHFFWSLESGQAIEHARTAAINTLVAGQVVYLFNCRSIVHPALTPVSVKGARFALLATLALIVLQAAFTYTTPLQRLFGSSGLSAGDWARIALFSVALFALVEAEKAILLRVNRRRYGRG